MGVFLNFTRREQLKPGDHIYTYCKRYLYAIAHHGIYVGEGMVIHFNGGTGEKIGTGTGLGKHLCSSHSCSTSCLKCSSNLTKTGGVICTSLDYFLSGGKLHLFQYGVSLAVFLAQVRGGTCTRIPSDPTKDVLHRAYFLLENGFGNYNLFKNNCEDFAVYCKTGLVLSENFNINIGRSGQIASYIAAGQVVVYSSFMAVSVFLMLPVICAMPVAIPFLVINEAAAISSYFGGRVNADFGARRHVFKVRVEDLVDLLRQHVPENTAD